MKGEMEAASTAMLFEKAGRIRDEIRALDKLSLRGDVGRVMQPEVFQIDPKKGLAGLRKVLGLAKAPRSIEGIDIAHLGGQEMVASLVSFVDGLVVLPGYRRYKISTVAGVDGFRVDPRSGVLAATARPG